MSTFEQDTTLIWESYESEDYSDVDNKFYTDNNIDPDTLSYAGEGNFGEAFIIDDGSNRVMKKTTSDSELKYAKILMESPNPYFVKIYFADTIGSDIIIIMEELDIDSDIEDLWYRVNSLLETIDTSISEIQYVDIDSDIEEEIPEDIIKFIDELQSIMSAAQGIAGMSADVRPENLGYSKEDGSLKMFDLDDRGGMF